jgi:hypothetical protein
LRGHHQDIKAGIEVLDGFARIINGLGDVVWGSMSDISRGNYFSRIAGDTLHVKPFGIKLSVKVPEGVTGLVIDAPAPGWDAWRVVKSGNTTFETNAGERTKVDGAGEREVTIERGILPAPAGESANPLPAMAIVRRLLTEGRDRVSAVYSTI